MKSIFCGATKETRHAYVQYLMELALASAKDGKEIENVQPSKKNVSLTAVLFKKKTGELEVAIEGLEAGSFRRSVSAPKTVTLKGRDSVLASIDKITCQSVNLEDVYEDTQIALTPILPS